MKVVLEIEPRSFSRHWSCLCCSGEHAPQMVQMVWVNGRIIGKACIPHTLAEIAGAACSV